MNQATLTSLALLIARLTLGVVFFAHGAQKVLGWFGGFGISGTAGYFQNTLGAPAALAYAGVFAEFTVSILLLTGTSTGLAALIAMAQMAAAIYFSHIKDGFFMNYFGQLPAGREGYEYNLVLIGIALVLFIAGAGRYSLDSVWGLDFVRELVGFEARP
jgi:putative oxidoreductase